jgi:hypothetical protein
MKKLQQVMELLEAIPNVFANAVLLEYTLLQEVPAAFDCHNCIPPLAARPLAIETTKPFKFCDQPTLHPIIKLVDIGLFVQVDPSVDVHITGVYTVVKMYPTAQNTLLPKATFLNPAVELGTEAAAVHVFPVEE